MAGIKSGWDIFSGQKLSEKVADIDKELKLVQDVLKFLFVRKES